MSVARQPSRATTHKKLAFSNATTFFAAKVAVTVNSLRGSAAPAKTPRPVCNKQGQAAMNDVRNGNLPPVLTERFFSKYEGHKIWKSLFTLYSRSRLQISETNTFQVFGKCAYSKVWKVGAGLRMIAIKFQFFF